MPNLAVTGEMSFFRVPEQPGRTAGRRRQIYRLGHQRDLNVNRYVGAQVGYRSINAFYDVDTDNGSLKFRGIYFGAVIRY